MTQQLYKVLSADGRSCSGGDFDWSLPTSDGPGDWHEIPKKQPLRICSTGFHLTVDPSKWLSDGERVFLAEYDGEATGFSGDKISVRKVRLTRELTAADVADQHGVRILSGAPEMKMLFGVGYGYGDGDGDGDGDGYGDGYGYGYGYGDGYGDGYGYGYGYGYGDGDGYGYGYGDGDGSSST